MRYNESSMSATQLMAEPPSLLDHLTPFFWPFTECHAQGGG